MSGRERRRSNAADPRYVRIAERFAEAREKRAKDFYRAVLATVHGRAVLWDLISQAGVFESPWSQFQMEIHRNIGRQDFGRKLLAEVIALDQDLYLLMETEARERGKRDEQEIDAAYSALASQQGDPQ